MSLHSTSLCKLLCFRKSLGTCVNKLRFFISPDRYSCVTNAFDSQILQTYIKFHLFRRKQSTHWKYSAFSSFFTYGMMHSKSYILKVHITIALTSYSMQIITKLSIFTQKWVQISLFYSAMITQNLAQEGRNKFLQSSESHWYTIHYTTQSKILKPCNIFHSLLLINKTLHYPRESMSVNLSNYQSHSVILRARQMWADNRKE